MRSKSGCDRQHTGSMSSVSMDQDSWGRWSGGAAWIVKSNVYTKHKVCLYRIFMFVFKGKGQKIDTITIMLSSFAKFIFSFRENRAS